jgi:diguanylate cyclase (GGDEF)-like protein/PAS domain S-box-containing protein
VRIRTQIVAVVLGTAALIGLVGGVAVYSQLQLTQSLALTEATSVARLMADTLVFRTDDPPRPLLEKPEALQEYLDAEHRRAERDFIVVDRARTVLANSSDEPRINGQKFNEDEGKQLDLTFQDGVPRHFAEIGREGHEGDELLAVPMEYPRGTILGAILLEYEPVLEEAQDRATGMTWLVSLCAAVAVLLAAAGAGFLLRRFSAGLGALTQGFEALAKGDKGARIAHAANNEFGQLATGFNSMADQLQASQQQLLVQKSYIEDIIQTAAEGIAVIDGNGRVTTINPAAATLLGRRAGRIAGQDWRSVISMHDASGRDFARSSAPVELALTTGRQQQSELRLTRPDGSQVPVVASCSPLSGAQDGVVLTLSDISELRRAEGAVNERAEELALLNSELQQKSETTSRLVKLGELLQACVTFPEAFAVVGSAMSEFLGGLSGTVHLTSASRNLVEEMAHWGATRSSVAQFAPEDCWALRRGQEHVSGPGMLAPRCAHVTENGPRGFVCMPLAAQGETLGILHLCEPNAADNPRWLAERQQILRGVVDTLALALANLRLRETLRQQSIRDPNTGLFNRRYLEETASRELRRVERSKQPLAMIMLDVDHFKQFNDTFGHEAGDLVLKQIAGTLLDHARESDVVSRYGGEEFAVVMPGASLAEGAERAEALRQAIRQLHLTHRGRTLGTITASLGVAASPEHGPGWAELANVADHALYQAKADGRDRVVPARGSPQAEPLQVRAAGE